MTTPVGSYCWTSPARKASIVRLGEAYADAVFQSASSVRRLPGVIAVLVVALALTGCSTATEQLEAAVSDASSAVSTARLATKQQAKDRTFLPTTKTALGDAVTALNDAAASAARVEPTGTTEGELQQRALMAIRGGTDAVLTAQRTITSDAGQAIPGLAESANTLRTLADELEKATR